MSVFLFWGGGLNGQTLLVNPTILNGFTYAENAGPSASQSYILSGTNLTPVSGDITITGSINYEVSANNSTFGPTATVSYSGGSLTGTLVYVRLKIGLTQGDYIGELIVNFGGGATDVSVTCNGNITCTLPAAPTEITASPASICTGASSTISVVDPGVGFTTDWYTVSCGGTLVAGGNSVNSLLVSPATTTIYYAQTRNTTTGCVSACMDVTVTVNALSAAPTGIAASPASICAGASSTISVADPGVGFTTDWYTVSCGGTLAAGGNGVNSLLVSPAITTIYYVQTRNTTTGCVSACMDVTVTVNALPAAPSGIAASPASICYGASSTISVTDPGVGFTTDWYTVSCGGTLAVGGNGVNSLLVSPATTTIYYAQTRNTTTGCVSACMDVTVTVNALSAAPTGIAASPASICTGASSTISVADPGVGFTTDWYTVSCGGNAVAGGTGVNSLLVSPATTTIYYAQTRNTTTGCGSACMDVTVTVNALSASPMGIAASPASICTGASSTISVADPGVGFTTDWYTVSCGGNAVAGGTGVNSLLVSPGTTTIYYAQTRNTTTGCVSACTDVTVTVNTLSATPTGIAASPASICNGASSMISVTDPGAGFTTDWYTVSCGGNAVAGGIGVNSLLVSPGTTTIYYAQTRNTTTGCVSACTDVTVTVNTLSAAPTGIAASPASICNGASSMISVTDPGIGFTTDWYTVSCGGIAVAGGNGVNSLLVSPATTTIYYAQTRNTTTGCVSACTNVTVIVNALPATPTISAGGPTTFCAGGNVTLTSSTGTTYLWSNSAITASINVTTAGSYTVQVTNAAGCQSAASLAIVTSVDAIPVADAGTDATIPNGTSTTLNATVTGTGPFTYSWSPAGQLVNALIEDPTTVNLATTTVFILTATSTTTSCSNMDAVTVTVSGGPLSSTPTATPGTVCAGDIVQLDAVASGGNAGSYIYTWTSSPAGFTSSLANPIANPAVNTTYNVAVFDGFTIVNSSVAVAVNALPATPTVTTGGPTTFCAGGNVTLTSSAGSIYLWSTGATTASINVTASGSYTIQVTNAAGCQSAISAATVVTVNAMPSTPTISAGGSTTFCSGGSVTLTSSAGTSYLWSTGATTASINVTAAGSYTVQVADAAGCQSAASLPTVVTVNALPATPTIAAVGPTTFCAGGNVTLTSSAGTTYLWSNSATTANINVTAAGSYTVQVTNAAGCQSAASLPTVVTVNALPATPTIAAGGPTTFCAGGNVALTSSAGSSYLWSTGATTASINVTASGSYMVQVTDAAGCQSAASLPTVVTVNALPATPTNIAASPATICNGGSSTISVNNPGNGYTTDWYTVNCGGNAVAGGNGVNFLLVSPATTTVYYARTRNTATGCVSACANVTVTVNALSAAPTGIAASPASICTGASSTISVTNPGIGFTTDWYTVNCGGTAVAGGNGVNSLLVSPATTTVYYARTRNTATGCVSACANVTVTVNALSAAPTGIAASPATICNSGSSTISVNNPGNGYTTDWYTVNCGGNAVAGGNGVNFLLVSPATTTVYYARTRNTATGCVSACANVMVTVNALSAAPTGIAASPASICTGASSTISVTNPGIGFTTDWYTVSCGGTAVAGGNGVNFLSVSPETTTVYYARTRNTATSCVSACANVTVTVNALPSANITGAASICIGKNTLLTSNATAGSGSITNYQWNLGGTPISGATAASYTAASAGSYTVTITNSYGCSFTSTAFTVTINALPTANITGAASFCTGGNTVLTSNATAVSGSITNYQWNLGGTPISGATAASYSAASAGSYTATITNSIGCSFTSTAFTVTINALPSANITGAASFCTSGTTLLTSNANAGSGSITNYQWNLGGTPISGATAASYSAASAGSYTVTITNSIGCSFTSTAYTVTINALPSANITGTTSFCSGGNTPLTSNATAGSGTITSYQWNLGGTLIDGAIAASCTANAAGSYTVTITNSNGCLFTSTAFAVLANALPSANITGTASFCTGGNTLLTSNATAGSGSITNYQWNLGGTPISGATAANYSAASAGSYTVTITNSNGCSFTSTPFAVTINALPTANITGAASFCTGGNTPLTSNATAGSGSITNYQWNLGGTPISGATAASYTTASAGSYTVTITNSIGCSFTSTAFTVTINALPTANITGAASFCTGGNTVLTSNATAVSGSITNYQWNLGGTPIDGAIAASYPANTAGSYTVTITNSNGCIFTSALFAVSEYALPTVNITGTPSFCTFGNTLLNSNATAGSGTISNYQWNLGGIAISGATAASFTAAAPGSYTVTISNSVGCSYTSTSFLVTVNALPSANITGTDSFCTYENTLLTSNATSGSGSITNYQWNLGGTPISGATTASYTAASAGSYTVTITNSNGCSFTSTPFTVTINALPTANITGATSFCTGGNSLLSCNATAGSGTILKYQWNLAGLPISGALAATYTAFAAGSYTVTITNSNGCTYTSTAFVVTVNASPIANITGTASFCTRGNTMLTSNATAGSGSITNYQWNLGGIPISGSTATTYAANTAGSYTVTITNSNNCSYTSSAFVVTVNALPIAPAASVTVQPTCTEPTGTIIITSPTIGLTFNLDGSLYAAYPAGGYTIVSPGPHILTAQNATNCISAGTNVIVNPIPNGPTALASTTANASCGLSNGTITLGAATGGIAPYTYSVDASAFTASTSYTGMAAGPHSVKIRDANGCIFSTGVIISNDNGPTAVVSILTNASCGLSNGTIALGAVTGGTAPYTYSVDASAFTVSTSYAGMAEGIHSVQVRDVNGCIFSTSATINNASGPTAIASTPVNATCGLSNGTITLGAVTGGTPPYSYSIDASAFTTSTAFSGMAEGSHNVQVKDAKGCIFSTSVIISNASGPTAIVSTLSNASCGLSNGTITLGTVTSGSTPYTYSVDASAFNTSTSYSGIAAGTHSVQVKDANGCIFSKNVNISNASGPTSITATPANASCGLNNGTIILGAVTGGTPPYAYSVDGSAFNTSTTFSGMAAGLHIIQVRDANGCIFSTSATISNASGPIALAATSANASCGLSNGTITMGAVTGGTAPFTYSVDASAFSASTSYSGMAAGPHIIEVRDANGCIFPTSATISNASGPTAIAATPANTSCGLNNGTITLGAVTGGTAPYTYSVDVSAFTASTSYSGLIAGSHSIRVRDANSCIFTTNVSISNTSGPTAIVATSANTNCGQSNGTITLGAVSGGTAPYTYSIDASAYTASTSYSGLTAGSHSILVRDANGCNFTTSVSIGNTSGPIDIATTNVNASCGLSNGTISLGAVTGGTFPYTYSVDASAFTASTAYSGMAAGTHSVQVRDANGCIFSKNVNISNASGPTAIDATHANTSCGMSNGTITLGAVTGGIAPYTYSIDASAFTALTSYSGMIAGSHSIQVRDANGCIFSTTITITEASGKLEAPVIGAISQPSCTLATGSVALTGLPALNWIINPGAITGIGSSATISGLVAGSYNYSVTSAEGCISQASKNITILAAPGSPTAPIVGTITQSSCNLATGSVILNGLPELTWTINPGEITGAGSSTTISGLAEGTYNYTVTNADGCISPSSADVVITPSSSPTADFSFSLACLGFPTYFYDNSDSYPAPITDWTWVIKDSIQTIGDMTGMNSTYTFERQGSYTVIHNVTNSVGCIDSKTYMITVFPSPLSAFSLVDNYENIQGKILLENGSVGADEYFWDFGNNETSTEASPVITYSENGDFLIQLYSRNKYGCVDSSSIIYKILFNGLWVPNAISPGAVSSVSLWKPVGENLSSYKAEIYDRWGKLIWSSDKLVNGAPSEGWDGTYKGELCKTGSYLWKISATFKDGSIWPNEKVDFRQNIQDGGSGTITLIR